MFEPSQNDLKFTVWNCNYICTNLVFSKLGSIDEDNLFGKYNFNCTVFPGDSVVNNMPPNTRDVGSIPGWGGSSGEGNGNSL